MDLTTWFVAVEIISRMLERRNVFNGELKGIRSSGGSRASALPVTKLAVTKLKRHI
jgi:hypothetical protein